MLVVSGRATSTLCTGFVDPSHEVSVGLSCCKFCTGELSYPPLRNALACMNGPVAASSAIDLSCVCGYCGKSTAGVGGSCALTSSEGKSSCSLCIPMKLGKAGASNHQPTKYPGDNLPVFCQWLAANACWGSMAFTLIYITVTSSSSNSSSHRRNHYHLQLRLLPPLQL